MKLIEVEDLLGGKELINPDHIISVKDHGDTVVINLPDGKSMSIKGSVKDLIDKVKNPSYVA